MDEIREWSSFTTDFSGRTWKVDVSREAAEDFLGSENIDAAALEEWVDLNVVTLSAVAEQKVARGDHGSDWVRISSADVQSESRRLQTLGGMERETDQDG
ncbi:MAG: hypothetical protein V4610_01735 [Pseudomonadota bacterium]|jgi:hypothetical protein